MGSIDNRIHGFKIFMVNADSGSSPAMDIDLTQDDDDVEPITERVPRALGSHVRLRAVKVHELREALAAIYVVASDHTFLPLFTLDAALPEYLRGVYAWVSASTTALAELTGGLKQGKPAWALCRFRLLESRRFHMMQLEEAIRSDVEALRAVVGRTDRMMDLTSRVEELFSVAMWLEIRLNQRFG